MLVAERRKASRYVPAIERQFCSWKRRMSERELRLLTLGLGPFSVSIVPSTVDIQSLTLVHQSVSALSGV
jgi:hypothetical protein